MPASRAIQKFTLPLELPDLVFSKVAHMSCLEVAVLFYSHPSSKVWTSAMVMVAIFYALCV